MDEARQTRILILGGALLALLVMATLLPANPVWVTDNGNKYMILRSLAEQGTPALANPAAAIDPAGRYFPDGGFHFQGSGDRFLSVYPEFFSLLALPGYLAFGNAGLWILPIGGTLATLALFLAMLSRLGLSPRIELQAAGLLLCGSPLLFYSGTFWEMTLSCAFAMAALLAGYRKRFFVAGFMLGAGCVLREEFYLLGLIAGVAGLCFQRKNLRPYLLLGAGFLIPVVPLWIYNFLAYDHIFGLHGSLYYTHNREAVPTLIERVAGVFEGYWIYLFKFNSAGNPVPGWLDWLLALPFGLLAIAGWGRNVKFKVTAAALALAASACQLLRLWDNPDWAMTSGLMVGLFPSLPLLAGFLLGWRGLLTRGKLPVRVAALGCILSILILPPLLTRTDIGIIWGARHFLFIWPLLFLLSMVGFARNGFFAKKRRLFPVLFAGLSILLQLMGVRALFGTAENAAAIRMAVQESPVEVVVSDVFFLPEMTPELFFEKRWLYVKDDAALRDLPQLLNEAGVRVFTFRLSRRFRSISDWGLAAFLDACPLQSQPRPVAGNGFLQLFQAQCRLK